MAFSNILFGAGTRPAQPVVRKIDLADLRDALAKGADDFYAMPTHAIFLCIIYPIVGLALARLAFGYSILPLLYPLASGFALVGPIAALSILLLIIFVIWVAVANAIYVANFGYASPSSIEVFLHEVLTTRSGWN